MRANKIYQNERRFHDKNAEVAAAAENLLPSDNPADVLLFQTCECPNLVCKEQIEVGLDEYGQLVGKDLCFMVRPEHYLPEFERVVAKHRNYWIIEKKPDKLEKEFIV